MKITLNTKVLPFPRLKSLLCKASLGGALVQGLLGSAQPAHAVPASPDPVVVKQPDGTKLQVNIRGDEWYHWLETPAGEVVVQNPTTKAYVYAEPVQGGGLAPSDSVAGKVPPPLEPFRPQPPQNAQVMRAQAAQPVVAPAGTAKVLTILVTYSDTNNTVAASAFDNLLFGAGAGSMKSLYSEMSRGTFTVEAGPAGVLGWYRAPNTRAFYGDGYPRAAQLVRDIVQVADAAGVNFAPYDQDGDGRVDVVNIVHQGPGEETTGDLNDIWSHRWDLNSSGVGSFTTNDGVSVNDYIMNPELAGGSANTVGVFAHEYGHAMGLPDLYDIDGTSQGIGNWSLMAGGSYNYTTGLSGSSPAHMDAWCKQRLNWLTPINVTANRIGETIPAVVTSGVVYKIRTSQFGANEYFLVENRQRTGFDGGLPGAGLCIWHIDDAVSGSNQDNSREWYPGKTDAGHYRVALEQADGLFNMERNQGRGDGGDVWPGTSNKRTFNATSTPDSKPYSGSGTGLAVRNISNSGAAMTADLMVQNAGQGQTVTLLSPSEGATVGKTVALRATTSNNAAFNRMDFSYRAPTVVLNRTPKLAVADFATVTDTASATGAVGNIATATLSVNISHTWIGDLRVTLISPDGTRYVVHNYAGGNGQNIVQSYDLSTQLAGKARAGDWKLEVNDQAAPDSGTLNSWSLNLTSPSTAIGADTDGPNGSGEWTATWNATALSSGNYDIKALATDTDGVADLEDINSATLTDNTTPSISSVVLNSAPQFSNNFTNAFRTNDTFVAGVTASDAEGNALTYTYVWKNGTRVVKTTANTSSAFDTLDLSIAGNGDKGNVISVSVTVSDATTVSPERVASTIVQNSPPSMKPIALSTWVGRNILARPEFVDADGDPAYLLSVVPSNGPIGTITYQPSQQNTDGLFLYNARNSSGSDTFLFSYGDSPSVTTGSVQGTFLVGNAPAAGSRLYTALGASDVQGYGSSSYDLNRTTFATGGDYVSRLVAGDKLGTSPGTLLLSRRAINALTLAGASRSVNGQSTLSLAVADRARSYSIWYGPNDVLNELLPLLIANASNPANFNAAKTNYINNWKNGYTALATTLRGANPSSKFAAITIPDLGPGLSARAAAQLGLDANTQAALSSAITDACAQMSSHIMATFPSVDIQGQSDLGPNDSSLIFNQSTDLFVDGYHPNNNGYGKLGDRLFRLLSNKLPVNTGPASVSTLEATPIIFSAANGNAISISDVDAGPYLMEMTFNMSNGRVTFPNAPAGLVIGGTVARPVLTGTLNDLNSALEGMNFIPPANYSGTTGISIFTNDLGNGGGGANNIVKNVGIVVTAVNQAPVAREDSGSLAVGASLTLNVLANDTDQDGDILTVALPTAGSPTAPSKGTLVLNGDKSITYTNNGSSGSDSFIYTVSDGRGGSATATVTLAVTAPTTDVVDVTNSPISITAYGFTYNVRTKRYVQQVILKNTGSTPTSTPLFLVLDNLSSNATLFNKSGNITTFDASGSPYLTVNNTLAPGASAVVMLEFVRTGNTGISYSSRVLTGTGTP